MSSCDHDADADRRRRNRREILMYEMMRAKAVKEGRKQTVAELRLASLMRNRYPNGVLGVEGPGTEGTKVYATPAARLQRSQQQVVFPMFRAYMCAYGFVCNFAYMCMYIHVFMYACMCLCLCVMCTRKCM